MPLEGHWNRLNTPLRTLTARERRVVAAAIGLVLATALAIALVAAGSSSKPLRTGCIDAIVPGVMGGQPVQGCGAAARRICHAHLRLSDPGSRAIEASCARAGIAG
jgi:hypothetical protein